jgi:hypothetical protein
VDDLGVGDRISLALAGGCLAIEALLALFRGAHGILAGVAALLVGLGTTELV